MTDLRTAVAALECATEVMSVLPVCRTALMLLDNQRKTEALYDEIDNQPEDWVAERQLLYDRLSELSLETDRLNDELDRQVALLTSGPQERAVETW